MFRYASPFNPESAYPYGSAAYAAGGPRRNIYYADPYADVAEDRYAQALENRRRRAAIMAAEERERQEEARYVHALNERRRQAEAFAAAQQHHEYEEELIRREALLAHRKAALVAQAEQAQQVKQAKLKKVNKAATTISSFLKRALAKQAATRVTSGLRQIHALRTALMADVAAYTTALTEDPPRTEKQAYLQLLQHQDLLERSLLKTDSIVTHGDPFLRAQRKAIVAEIQDALTRLDADVDASSPQGSRASSISPGPTATTRPAKSRGGAADADDHFFDREEEEAAALASFFALLTASTDAAAAAAEAVVEEDEEEMEALQLFFDTALTTPSPPTTTTTTCTTHDATSPAGTGTTAVAHTVAAEGTQVVTETAIVPAPVTAPTITTLADSQVHFETLTRSYLDALATLDASLPAAQTPEQQVEREAFLATLQQARTVLPLQQSL